ncbi:hypothetical protein [uncultured Cohaesibacter sp.]|uniref:hypothetical protein n=1 Tax=uncultured Cohaesibacter sp. TaxID=1002546 RepID=UPI0029C82C82|nr:hypothetical protein [uncultured Cohaesibacter sp.]
MSEAVRLPKEIRRCPNCAKDDFIARRATRGGGWGGQGIRALFECDSCGHKELLEGSSDRISQAISSALLLLLGLFTCWVMDPPGNLIVGLFLIALGGYTLFDSLFGRMRKMPVVGKRKGERLTVALEDEIFLTPEDKASARKRGRVISVVVLVALLLSVAFILWDLFYA